MIPQDVIDRILDRIDLVEFVREFVPLKKAGQNFKACCPFHKEKTPSFVVSPQKQIYHCFGCGEGGNAIGFLMKHESMPFPEAIEILAKRSGGELPRSKQGPRKDSVSTKLYNVNKVASDFYRKRLNEKSAEKARRYLKDRGVLAETAEKFNLGFAPEGWENLKRYFLGRGTSQDLLRKAGLTLESKKSRGDYDRFRNRIIFPIFNERGKVVAFGARVLDNSLPKYINSPETPIYNKSHILYGLNLSRKFIQKKGYAVIVEGYTDVIIPYQYGVNNIVATSGTALTAHQVQMLKRYTNTAVMVFDSDQAGQTASLRGLDILLSGGMQVKIASLPENEDPASFIAKFGKEAFEEIIENSQDLFSYKLDHLINRFSINDKASIVDEMLPTISKVDHAVTRSDYLKRLAEKLNVHESSLRHEMKKVKKSDSYDFHFEKKEQKQKSAPCRMSELHILGLAVIDKNSFNTIVKNVPYELFKSPKIASIMRQLGSLYNEQKSHLNFAKVLSRYENDPESKALLLKAVSMADITKDTERVLSDCMECMHKENRDEDLKTLNMRLKQAQNENDQNAMNELLDKINRIHKQKVA